MVVVTIGETVFEKLLFLRKKGGLA